MTKVNRFESSKGDVFVEKAGVKYKVLDLGGSTIEIRVKSDKELAKDESGSSFLNSFGSNSSSSSDDNGDFNTEPLSPIQDFVIDPFPLFSELWRLNEVTANPKILKINKKIGSR